jgi:hypothetical protein
MPAQAASPMMVRKIGFFDVVAVVESLILLIEDTEKVAPSFEKSRAIAEASAGGETDQTSMMGSLAEADEPKLPCADRGLL